jgi:hypothetical protein
MVIFIRIQNTRSTGASINPVAFFLNNNMEVIKSAGKNTDRSRT